MVPTLRTIMNSSYYYEYRENIHLGVESTPASVSCVWLGHRFGWVLACWLNISPSLRGPSPQTFAPLWGRLGLLPSTWGTTIKGNANGAEGIFGNARHVWVWPYDLIHLKKGLVPYLSGGGTENKYLSWLQANTLAIRLMFNTLLPMLYLYFRSIYLFHIIPSLYLSSEPFTGPQQILKTIQQYENYLYLIGILDII